MNYDEKINKPKQRTVRLTSNYVTIRCGPLVDLSQGPALWTSVVDLCNDISDLHRTISLLVDVISSDRFLYWSDIQVHSSGRECLK